MKIIIPMSGFGERFRVAGYNVPKPLIQIDGKPIISHVVDMFPGESDFIFICNQNHLDNSAYHMAAVLRDLSPSGKVVGIPPHKLGPVHAINQIKNLLDPSEQVIVNYCDFTCYWDWFDFKSFVNETECSGAIPGYRGFHPHSLGTTNYAYMRENAGWVTDIQEKKPFTSNRMQEYASSGTYYFRSADLMFDAFDRQVQFGHSTNGEYYVSMAYKQLFADHAPVAIYPLQHFMQWGTPGDLAEYNSWSRIFRELLKSPPPANDPIGSLIVPMAGMGSRFAEAGYASPKPLIRVSGPPMALQAVCDMPRAKQHAFVLREDMPGRLELEEQLSKAYPEAVLKVVPGLTDGQAVTAQIGLEALQIHLSEVEGPVTITVCDSGCLYDATDFSSAIDAESDTDILVWGIRGHSNAVRYPEHYGWLDVDQEGNIAGVSVKRPLSSPASDPIVLGTFTFKTAGLANEVIAKLIKRNGRVNGEFYLDSVIDDALAAEMKVRLFEVNHFLCWGVPNDLKTFEYWQSCFHKWDSHPYRIECDSRVPSETAAELIERYAKLLPGRPIGK